METRNKRRVPSPILTGYFNFRLDSPNTYNQFVPNNNAFSIPIDLRMQPCEILGRVENCLPIQGSRPDTNRYRPLSISIASAETLQLGFLRLQLSICVSRTQVIYFSHQPHIIELVHESAFKDILYKHTLAAK